MSTLKYRHTTECQPEITVQLFWNRWVKCVALPKTAIAPKIALPQEVFVVPIAQSNYKPEFLLPL